MNEKEKREDIRKKEKVARRKRIATEEELHALDRFKEQQFVDEVPLEDLKIEEQNQKDKQSSQNTSQSERKYKGK
ncbi:hypothetical protein [Gracilibacillus alcaliphilus]|uniref:hypothetical protein n=1 Tax=Gracilibacillus alcaliphilus TaxID=1401441 RepID=UPI001EF8C049|nr:hypothetical protein [Gracilibacillus alcaliphilus]MBM7679447.1 hypothetical protein [Gracilibacillus alcaliphilus]